MYFTDYQGIGLNESDNYVNNTNRDESVPSEMANTVHTQHFATITVGETALHLMINCALALCVCLLLFSSSLIQVIKLS